MARGGAIRKGLTLGLAAGVGAAAVRAARARRAATAGDAAPVWPPLPNALQDAPPLPTVEPEPTPVEAVTVAPVEPVLEADGTAGLVAEAAVLEAEGVTEMAEVDQDATAALRVGDGTADNDPVTRIADRFDADEDDRFMPLETGFEQEPGVGARDLDDDEALEIAEALEDLGDLGDLGDLEDDEEPAWGADLRAAPEAASFSAAAAEAQMADDALEDDDVLEDIDDEIDRFMPLDTGFEDRTWPAEPSNGSNGGTVAFDPDPATAVPAAHDDDAGDDLEAQVLAEEEALEAERLEAERLELGRLAAARFRSEEAAGDHLVARQQERQDALARFAAQRDEAQRLLALQEERAARADEPRRPMMAGDLDSFAAVAPPEVAAPDEEADEEAASPEERLWSPAGTDLEPQSDLLDDDQLDPPVLQPVVPDDAVADLDEDPVWGAAVTDAPVIEDEDEDDELLVPAPVDILDEDEDEDEADVDDEGSWAAAAGVVVVEDEDEAEEDEGETWAPAAHLDAQGDAEDDEDAEDEEEDVRLTDHLWPDDDVALLDEDDEDEEQLGDVVWPGAGALDATEATAADTADTDDDEVVDEWDDQPVAVQVPVPPPPVAGGQPDTWAAWVKANPASWATWSDDDDHGGHHIHEQELEHAPVEDLEDLEHEDDEHEDDEHGADEHDDDTAADLAPAGGPELPEPEEEPLPEDEPVLRRTEPDWVPVGEPIGGKRRPLMTGDFDDVLPEELIDDEDEAPRPAPVAPPPPVRAPALRRSGRPRVPLKAKRIAGPDDDELEAAEALAAAATAQPVEAIVPVEAVQPVEPEPEPEVEPPAAPEAPARKAPAAKKAAAKKAAPKAATKKAPAKKSATKKAGATKATAAPAKKVSSRSRKKPEVLWVEPVGDTCPHTHPVKAVVSRGIFHVVGGLFYDRTKPERCYRLAAAAEADGLRQAKR